MTSMPLPESPRIAAVNALSYLSSPYRFYERTFARYGDTFLFHGPNGPVVDRKTYSPFAYWVVKM